MYDSWIGVDGPVGPDSTATPWPVYAYSTLMYDSGKDAAIMTQSSTPLCSSRRSMGV